ncbi:hypothetical protein [Helicobacter sp. 23-1045]
MRYKGQILRFVWIFGVLDSAIRKKLQNLKMDCHDSATQNLAMTKFGALDSAKQTRDSALQTKNRRICPHFVIASERSERGNPQLNQSCEAPKTRPLRGAKNREQASSSASADFLLEAEKRGTPPKSEKWQLLASRGSGEGGAAILREK